MKNTILLITVSLLTATSFVSPVKADEAVIQDSIQETIITGNGNYSSQHIRQENHTESRRRSSNQGTVQRIEQKTDILGNYNESSQTSVQINRTRSNSNRRP
jgi:hypothetical protein